MVEDPDSKMVTLLYLPLHRKNEHWKDPFEPSIVCEGSLFIYFYGQNGNEV